MHPIIDLHLDLSWNALSWNRDLTQSIAEIRRRESSLSDHPARSHATVCLPELRAAGVAVCLGTLLCRANPDKLPLYRREIDFVNQTHACACARAQLEYYRLLHDQNEIRLIATRFDLEFHWALWANAAPESRSTLPIGLIIAMEGCDPIISPAQADRWFADGLRCASLAHYGQSHYAGGTSTTTPLTAAGIELLKQFARLKMILDVTHTSDPAFFQCLDLYPGPIIASHNNCRTLVPHQRQFSDEQIRALVSRNAIIGMAFDSWMLSPDFIAGQTTKSDVPLENVVNHIDHICQLAGNTNHVAIGSDLDGGFGSEETPAGLDTIADLQKLIPILTSRGYRAADISNIFHANALRLLSQSLPQ